MNSDATILDGLNQTQREAVTNYLGAALIVAGAGSGKTRVLTSRIARMVEAGVRPGSILALTFTNKAASEMRDRISAIVPGGQAGYIWMGTFHSIFSRILRTSAQRLGFTDSYTIYDTRASETVISQVIKSLNLNTDQYKPREILSRISMAKNNLLTPESYTQQADIMERDRQRHLPAIAEIYRRYQAQCRANNAMDFDDILLYTNILFRDNADILEQWQDKFQYILVDEYQDTNYSQYLIIKRLAQRHNNICVVGDDSQSIYAFRGARIENILRFRNDYPQANIYKLEQNYRSTQSIVNAANSLIAHNDGRIPKNIFSEKAVGEAVGVMHSNNDREEALRVADEIKAEGKKRGSWNEIAVLYRNNSQSRSIEEALRGAKIPYIVYKGHSFYEHTEIRDVLAYLRLIVNPADSEALARIINVPARGIGETTVSRLQAMAQIRKKSLWEMLCSFPADHQDFRRGARALVDFRQTIEELMRERRGMDLYEFGVEVVTRSGYLSHLRRDNSPEGQSRLANVGELLTSMQGSDTIPQLIEDEDVAIDELPPPTLEEWLANVALMTDADNDRDSGNRVTLMTVHAAKGLEYDVVFVVGVEENLFPSMMSVGSKEGVEEERRLFYVALTRARERAIISCARERFKWGKTEQCRPSRFIGEIDSRYIALPASMGGDTTDEDPLEAMRRKLGIGAIQRPQVKTQFRPNSSQPGPNTSQPSPANSSLSVGQRVSHPKFGEGTILAVDMTPTDLRLSVCFNAPQYGTKTLLAKYANLVIIE